MIGGELLANFADKRRGLKDGVGVRVRMSQRELVGLSAVDGLLWL